MNDETSLKEVENSSRLQKSIEGFGRIFKPRWTRKHKDGSITHHESPFWWVAYSHEGEEHRASSKSTDEDKAIKFLRQCVQDLGKGKITAKEDRVTFATMAEDLRNDYRINGKRSVNSIELSIKHLQEFFDNDKARRITTDRIRTYIAQRQETGAANASINRELSTLKRMFALAMQAGRLSSAPYIPMLKENNARQGFVNPGEFLLLRESLPDYLKDPVTFLYQSGWRVSEMKALEWHDVDLTGKVIRLRPEHSKNYESRVLPLGKELLGVIERAGGNRRLDCPYVFHHGGQPIGDFRKAWATACKAAGLTGIIVHDLRRSAIRNMVRAGIHERVAMRLSGHKTRSIFDRYNITSEKDLVEATEKLQTHLQEQTQGPVVVPIVLLSKKVTG